MNRKTDHKMLRRLGRRDGDWETFFSKYYSEAVRLAMSRVKNNEDAQDVAQIVIMKFVRLFQRGWVYDPKKSFGAYFAVVVKRTSLDFIEKKPQDVEIEDEMFNDPLEDGLQWLMNGSREQNGEEDETLSEEHQLLREALDELSEKDRRVLTYDGKGVDLAEEMGITDVALRAQRFRAKPRLMKELRRCMVRRQTVRSPWVANDPVCEHLNWAAELILDQQSEVSLGPSLIFRRQPLEPTSESIRIEPPAEIGRSMFASLEPPIYDSLVSGRHCRIEHQDDSTWLIEDLGSRNHTYVNGLKLVGESSTILRDGDRLGIGKQLLVFSTGELPPGEAL